MALAGKTTQNAPAEMPTPTPGLISVMGRFLGLTVLAVLLTLVLLATAIFVVPHRLVDDTLGVTTPLPTIQQGVAITCALFFVITMCLWIFDAIGFFPFRNSWMSKSIWASGLVSIFSTSVIFYSQAMHTSITQTPALNLLGVWQGEANYQLNGGGIAPRDHEVVVTFDPDSGEYVAQSDAGGPVYFETGSGFGFSFRARWRPGDNSAIVRFFNPDLRTVGDETFTIGCADKDTKIEFVKGDELGIILARRGPVESIRDFRPGGCAEPASEQ